MDKLKLIPVQIINAFVADHEGGNPAGVVLNADHLSFKNKLEIAHKIGLSETAFVSSSQTETLKLDFFTPTKQIAHCGHATIATFSYLKQKGMLKGKTLSKETIDGNRKIKILGANAFMEQMPPKYTSLKSCETLILKSLNIKKTALIPNASIQLVNTGNSFVIIPLKNARLLKELNPDFELITKISEDLACIGFYAFTTETQNSDGDATTRMFAPNYGILEEAATGMAAGPLACYLFDVLKQHKNRFMIQQGDFMKVPSPSLLIVELTIEHHKIIQLMAGGKGVFKEEIMVTILE
jgi:PhzF family phenazine biosynthesis protein